MKVRRGIGAVVGIVALVIPAAALSADGDKATGGGQVLIGSSGKRSTITFTAQQTGGVARGQLNFIDRSAGAGQNQVHTKGTITCIEVNGNTAEMGGTLNDEDQTPFYLRVVDNGEGANAGNDMILFDSMDETGECAQESDDDENFDIELAKGNVQVHKQKAAKSGSRSQSKTSSSSTTVSKSLTSLALR